MEQTIAMELIRQRVNPRIRWHGAPKVCRYVMEKVTFDQEMHCLVAAVRVIWPRMTRKRFERVLKALGMKDRDARMIADEANARNIPYNKALTVVISAGVEAEAEESE